MKNKDADNQRQPPGQLIRVMIVEDDPVTLRVLCKTIASNPAFEVAAKFDAVLPAIEWLRTASIDICLTDLGLPDGSGIEVIRACASYCPSCNIMVISMSSDEDNILACIEAGASGYILKDAGRTDIIKSLFDMHAGGSPISPMIARKVLDRLREAREGEHPINQRMARKKLTERETSILHLIARGDSYGQVAHVLSLSVGTVQTHVKNIYGKLSVHSRGEAVYEAQRRGLLQLNDRKKEN